MKLVGDLKKKVEKAGTRDEMKAVIAEAGMELNEKELDMVTGGGRVTTEVHDDNAVTEDKKDKDKNKPNR